MGLFGKRIDIKNATKTTYSEDDLTKLDFNYQREFTMQGGSRIYTPYRREIPRAWLTQIRDMAFEKILDDHLFTFKHLLVIPNPYGASVQTALLLFNTSRECSVRYRILGKVDGTDFVGETEVTTRHRVPVMGLYKGYTNKLKLELLDENGKVFRRRDLTIYARDISLALQNIVTKVEHKELSRFPFILVNGEKFNPIVLDQNGEVRYSLQIKTNKMGMIPLQGGRFLFADTSANQIGPNGKPAPCQYHEIDYMGRIYRTYLLDFPISHVAAQRDDSLFLLTVSDGKHDADCIIEVDRNNGQVKKRCALSDILGTKYQDRRQWTTVTAMKFCQGKLLLSFRRLHTVLEMDWESGKVQWVLAPASIWRETPLENCLLSGEDGQAADGYLPEHFDVYMEDDTTMILRAYYLQNRGLVPAEGAKSSPDSRIVFYRIREKDKSFYRERQIDVVKSKRFGSSLYDLQNNRILSLSGSLSKKSQGLFSCIEELEGEHGDVINRLRLGKVFHKAWIFEPDIKACSQPSEKKLDVIYGHLAAPSVYDGEMPQLSEERLRKRIFGNIRVCGDLFLFGFYPGTVKRVYLVGENNTYMVDYSMLKLRRKKQSFAIALDRLKQDEYQICVEYDGNVYQLKNEIRVEGS